MLEKAQFEIGAAVLSQLPPDRGREVAFAGRSNAGKSSAINALTNRRRLAFVSKTPGRTQQINFYALGAGRYLVDLPGYGYARVSGQLQQRWERVLSAYLQRRASLQGLVLIMDIRHPLTPLDRSLLDWFAPTGKPLLVLLTKADKLSRQEAARQLHTVRAGLERSYPGGAHAILFSAVSRQGVEAAKGFVAGLLGGENEAPAEYNPSRQRKAPG
jgi:GTP-binding protein